MLTQVNATKTALANLHEEVEVVEGDRRHGTIALAYQHRLSHVFKNDRFGVLRPRANVWFVFVRSRGMSLRASIAFTRRLNRRSSNQLWLQFRRLAVAC